MRPEFVQSDSMAARQRESPVSLTPSAPSFVGSPGRLIAFLVALFAAHVVVRLITSPATVLDESEQLVFSQAWQWGYGPQPPLYTWLQIPVFNVFGSSIFALSLFKNALLLSLYLLTYANGRIVTQSHTGGVIAALSLLFIPQLSWESQRDLTHSVLATVMASATLFVFLRLHLTRSRWLYFLLGALFGLGALSNYNYALLFVGLLGAALCLKEFRPLVLTPWMPAAFATAALLLWPHALWIRDNWSVVVSTSHKLQIQSESLWIVSALSAIWNLAMAWLTHVISVILILAALCWKQFVPFPRDVSRRPLVQLILFLLLCALVSVLVAMIASNATNIKGRWLQPVYSCLSIVAAAFLCERATASAVRWVVITATVVAVAVLILLPARVRIFGRVESLNTPYAELAAQIGNELIEARIIIADSKLVGGNLQLIFPEKIVVTPRFIPRGHNPPQGRAMVVFNATLAKVPLPELKETLSELGLELNRADIHYVEAPLRWNARERARLGWVAVKLPVVRSPDK